MPCFPSENRFLTCAALALLTPAFALMSGCSVTANTTGQAPSANTPSPPSTVAPPTQNAPTPTEHSAAQNVPNTPQTKTQSAANTPTTTTPAPTTVVSAVVDHTPATVRFSQATNGQLPAQWQPLIIRRDKRKTVYEVAKDGTKQRMVLHATANAAASGLHHSLSLDPALSPWLRWQWRVPKLIAKADNLKKEAEDSPVRIVLAFDGDVSSLSFGEQMKFELAKLASGQEPPYATLMYIWENKVPVGTVIDNAHTSRIKKVVAASGPQGLGQWQRFERNFAQDYQRAFGKPPGRLIGVGVLTDTDNTKSTVNAWYGDIEFWSHAAMPARSE